eukprot:m.28254 g.28254  ORF g.28254 m.28254 type:complete len:500 (+) comp4914_c0_seq1:89-1588(+)
MELPEWLAKPSVPVLAGAAATLAALNYAKFWLLRSSKAPPFITSWVPFLGQAAAFGQRPVDFMLESYSKYGPVFSFWMLGSEVTYLLGSEASAKFWSSHNDELNAEDLYKNITVPVFGKGVAFDVPHKVFSEQKRMAKAGLTQERFDIYVSFIENEARDYLARFGDEGEMDFSAAMQEMIIYTATRCLHGLETRERFDATVAALYHDLDGGLTPLAWLAPPWIPFPSFRKRDKAHLEIMRRFKEIIEARRQELDAREHNDLLETFMTVHYTDCNDKRALNDDEIGGLLIALLMAGHHTSSTTSSWLGFYLAAHKDAQDELHREQVAVLARDAPLDRQTLETKMPLLHGAVRETLRLRPPIMQLMRKCRVPFSITVKGREYFVPAGNQVVVSPSANHLLEDEWDEPEKFDPHRFINSEGVVTQGEHIPKGGKFKWVPFGAGRHRCIGFEFAQIQIRVIFSILIREFELELPETGFPATNYQTMIHNPANPMIRYRRRPRL